MSAYMKLGDIKGQSTDEGHKDWVMIESMSSPIYRSIPEGAKDNTRTQGSTTLGDVVVVRTLDKSSTKIQEACANGTFLKEVEIHFCSTIKNKQEPLLKYKLENVIITSYSFHGNQSGSPVPSEQVTLGFTKVEWTYCLLDPNDGSNKGNVVGKYNPAQGKA